ncbi:MAG: uncharacterized protein A8A55_3371, partial [Amphiamblys sp. WSBS2006]
MHFVICRECVQDIKERENRAVVECPFCREKTSKKEHQEEILEMFFSLRTQQTLLSLEMRLAMEIETVSELKQTTRVVLSNCSISDKLFLFLISRTKMDIRGWISLFGDSNSSVCCYEGLTNETSDRIDICTNGYNKEKIENIEENTKKMQKRNISIKARDIHAEEKGVCILLKHCTVDALVCYLGITEKKYIEEILGDENQRVWAGRVKNLQLRD